MIRSQLSKFTPLLTAELGVPPQGMVVIGVFGAAKLFTVAMQLNGEVIPEGTNALWIQNLNTPDRVFYALDGSITGKSPSNMMASPENGILRLSSREQIEALVLGGPLTYVVQFFTGRTGARQGV